MSGVRNAAPAGERALLDESGLLFVCADADIVEGLRRHRWRETFWERRAEVDRGTQCGRVPSTLQYAALTAAVNLRRLAV